MKTSTMRAGESWLTRERAPGDFLPTWSGREWLSALALLAAVFLVYLPVWRAGFVWDDRYLLLDNPTLQGLRGLQVIWTSSYADIGPLMATTFWAEHQFWGDSPLPYHLVNVLLHGACAVVVWRVLLALKAPGAWLGAALWALHPVNVESVAWVSELKNTQSGLFYLLAILVFIRWLKANPTGSETSTFGDYTLFLVLSALAMATKSSTVVLPAVLCLVAWWLEGKWDWRNLARVAPVFVLGVAASALSIWTQSSALSTVADPTSTRTLPERIATAGMAVWFYLAKLAWPHPVMTIYPRWNVDATSAASYVPLLVVILAIFLLWLRRESWARAPFFVFAYFLCALLPVLGLFDNFIFQYSLVFDHLQYLASMGPLALAGAGLARLAERIAPGKPNVPAALGGGLLLILAILSWQRVATFQTEETLWTDTIAKDPNSVTGHFNLAVELVEQGRTGEAKTQYQRVLQINPNYTNAHANLGMLWLGEGRADDALAEIQQALKINPTSGDAYNALGWIHLKRGEQDAATAAFKKATEVNPRLANAALSYGENLLHRGQVDAAIAELGRELSINANIPEVYYDLGLAFEKKGQMDLAMAAFEKTVEIDPTRIDAYNKLGLALVQEGKLDAGVVQYQKALEFDPKSGETESNLGVALFQAGLRVEAMKHLGKALELDPSSTQANNNMGNALLASGQVDAAIAQYQKTVQLDPAFADVRRNLGVAFLMKGKNGDAICQLKEAVRLNPADQVAQGLLVKAQADTSRVTH